jgi:hypothetical protein
MIAPTPSKMATHAKEWKDKSFWPSAGHINYPPKGLAKKKSVYESGLFNANRIWKKHNARSPRFLRQLQMQNQRIMGENPRVGIKPETRNSA